MGKKKKKEKRREVKETSVHKGHGAKNGVVCNPDFGLFVEN